MPNVEISIRAGRGDQVARDLISSVTTAVVETLKVPSNTVRVIVTEVPATHWGIGEMTLAEKMAEDGLT